MGPTRRRGRSRPLAAGGGSGGAPPWPDPNPISSVMRSRDLRVKDPDAALSPNSCLGPFLHYITQPPLERYITIQIVSFRTTQTKSGREPMPFNRKHAWGALTAAGLLGAGLAWRYRH